MKLRSINIRAIETIFAIAFCRRGRRPIFVTRRISSSRHPGALCGRQFVVLLLVAAFVSTINLTRVRAAGGDLDPSFDLDGIAITDFGPKSVPTAIAVQADGKTLVAGYVSPDSTSNSVVDFALVRYNLDGRLDPSFGDGGKVLTDFGGYDRAYGIAIQPAAASSWRARS